jgi:hypothetical protein
MNLMKGKHPYGRVIRALGPFFIGTNIILGKDYSNPRVVDFYDLHKPDEDMYDRSKVPRMPWYGLGNPFFVGSDWVIGMMLVYK